jgi:hypothetical protein
MIQGFGGRVLLTWSSLYLGILWLIAGALCTLLTRRRGLYLAILLPVVVALIPNLFWVNGTGVNKTFQWLRYGSELSPYWTFVIIPFFASLVGGLIGELISPSQEE